MTVDVRTKVTISATIEFTEGQLRALDALVGYGDDAFLKAFNVKLGTHYIKPFERDLRELFAQIRKTVPPALRNVKAARERLAAVHITPEK
jgi:hypothetical protein